MIISRINPYLLDFYLKRVNLPHPSAGELILFSNAKTPQGFFEGVWEAPSAEI